MAKSFPHLITTIKPHEPCYVGPSKMDRSWWRIPTICGPLEKEIGKPLQYSCPENPMNNMKRQKDMTTEDEPLGPGSVGVQYATREEWRNSSRKNEEAGPK